MITVQSTSVDVIDGSDTKVAIWVLPGARIVYIMSLMGVFTYISLSAQAAPIISR